MKSFSLSALKAATLFLIVGVFVLGFHVDKTYAGSCTLSGSGTWSATASFTSGCTGAASGGSGTNNRPGSGDTVTAPAAGLTLTVDVNTPSLAAFTVSTWNTTTSTTIITINAGASLNVSGTFTVPQPTANSTQTISISGTLDIGALTYTGTTTNRLTTISIDATTGKFTLRGTATVTSGGTKTIKSAAAGTIELINATIPNTSTLTWGTFASGTDLIASGTTTISKTTAIATWGDCTISSGTFTTAALYTCTVSLTNNGTWAGTGGVTLSGASGTITGTGSVTNTGTFTISGTTAPSFVAGSNQTLHNLTIAANALLTVNGTLTINNGLTIAAISSTSKTPLTLASTANLTVSGTTSFTLAAAALTSTINIGAATATFGGTLTMTGSTTSSIGKITLTSGTINFNNGINTAGTTGTTAADHVIDFSGGAGAINVKGQVMNANSPNASGWTFTNTTCSGSGNTFTYADFGNSQNATLPGSGGYCNLVILSGDSSLSTTAITTTNVKGDIIIGDDVHTVSVTNTSGAIAGNAGKSFILNNLATYKQTNTSGERMPTGFGTITIDPNSTVEYDSTAGYTISSSYSFGNLAFKPTTAGLTFTLPSSVSIAGDLVIGDGTNSVTVTANTNDPTLSIPGAFTINDGGTFTASSTQALTVTGDMTIGGGTSGTFTETGSNVDLNGNLTINAGATFTKNASSQLQFTEGGAQSITDNTVPTQDLGAVVTSTTSTNVSSATDITVTDLTIGSGTTFNITGDTLTLTDTSGTLITNSGTFTTTSSTITVTGTSTKTLETGVTDIGSLVVSSSGTNNLNILSDLDVNGSLTVNSPSVLTVNTANFIVTGSASNAGTITSSYTSGLISVGGDWTNTGTFTAGTSTLKLTGTGAIAFAGGGATYNDVWFAHGSGTGTYTVSDDNIFSDLTDDGTAAHTIQFTAGSTQHFTTWNVSGHSGALITITSTTTAVHNLVLDGGGTVAANYLNIQHSVATPSTATWFAGANSTNNQAVATAGSGWIFSSSRSAYGGTPWTIPGTVQAEDFDTGGQGVAYDDTDPLLNQAGYYRPSEGVDIEVSSDTGGGYDVGWFYNTEWMEYTVNVTTPGTYTISGRVASNASSQSLVFSIDGVSTATVTVPNTGGFQNWQTSTSSSFSLTSGEHIVRVAPTGNSTNLNYFTLNLVAAAACTSTATGNWNTSGTWDCGHVPAATESAVIATGHTVTMDVNSNALVTVTVNGTLNTAGFTLNVDALSIASGATVSASSSTINLTGTSGTLLTNAGTFTPSSSTVTLSGNGNATINSGTVTFNTLQLTGTGTKTFTAATTINGSLTINSGATLGTGGYDISVSGNITNNGTFTVGGGSWPYYKTITIDHTKVPNTDQSNFPVLISGTYTDLKTVANGGHVTNSSGNDIAFFGDTGMTSSLKWEIEKYVPTTGEIVAWVKVPTLSHVSDTLIYLAYGNSSINSDQSDKNNVWDSNYKAVWHMNNTVTGTGQTIQNSTTYSENLTTAAASGYSGGLVTGAVGNGVSIASATGDYLSFPQVTLSSDWTIEGWAKLSTTPGNDSSLFGNGSSGGGSIYNTNWFAASYRAWDGSSDGVVADTTTSSGAWNHYVITRSGTALTLYKDGVAHGTGTGGKTAVFQYLGVDADGSSSNNMNFDEVRISTSLRTADWIKTQYNNQNSPSTFYTMGSEQNAPTVSTISIAGDWTNAGTYNGGTSTVKMTKTSGTATFTGGGATYPTLWLAPGAGSTTFTIAGSNTFGEFKDNGSAAHTIKFTTGTTQTIGTWTVSGSSGNLITIDSTTTGTHALVKTGGQARSDYLNIQHSVATPAESWYAGDNSVNNNSVATAGSGWVFTTLVKHRGGGSVRNAGGETDNGTGAGTCADGIQNGNETGVDTGGRCVNTGGGSGGGTGGAGESTGGAGAGTCSDGIKNGDETSIDQGGRCSHTGGGAGGGGGDSGALFDTTTRFAFAGAIPSLLWVFKILLS